MAKLYDDVFGQVCLPYRDKNEIIQEEEEFWQIFFKEEEEEQIWKGHVGIQEESKDIRQNSSKEVMAGTRSGSGKIDCLLKKVRYLEGEISDLEGCFFVIQRVNSLLEVKLIARSSIPGDHVW